MLAQLAIPAPVPPADSYDGAAAQRGKALFEGKARCATCHVPPLYTEPGWQMHTGAEIGIDDFQSQRSPDGRYRTTPLKGLFARKKGGFYHDGRFADYAAVIRHYDGFLRLGLEDREKADLASSRCDRITWGAGELAGAPGTSQFGYRLRCPRMTPNAPSSRGRMGRSRLGGVATALAPAHECAPRQLALGISSPAAALVREVLLPGAVKIAGWLSHDVQRSLAAGFRQWALPPAGLRHPRVPSGHLMSVQSVCLGWHWEPYAYSKTADDTDGAPVKPLPLELAELARAAVAEAYGPDRAASYAPDAAIVNLYASGAQLGLHLDGEEPSDAPVVTLSLGDSCVFRFAGVGRRNGPFKDVELHSGDLLVFGGPSRRIYHGVPKVLEGTAPASLGLPPGRVSITLRETGL